MRSFLIGAVGYPLLELAWRGRTHPSMMLAGGMSAALIHCIGQTNLPPLSKALACGLGITAIEAGCGLVWNRRHQVWDYRHMPLNWRGQVCLPFSLAWCGLSAAYLLAEKAVSQASSPAAEQPAQPAPLHRP
ncbi:MAG: hypothetical protein J6M20_05815 [Clostridia bacterium]|nr:hypothetical protein [Clostridia bacterium]